MHLVSAFYIASLASSVSHIYYGTKWSLLCILSSFIVIVTINNIVYDVSSVSDHTFNHSIVIYLVIFTTFIVYYIID